MPETYHDKFLLYLESLHKFNEEKRQELTTVAEEQLPALLHMNDIENDGNIYSNIDTIDWNNVKTDSLIDRRTTEEEQKRIALTLEALKYFKGFVKFNRTANYKRLFDAKIRRERQQAAHTEMPDNSVPETENTARTEGSVTQVCVTHYERNPEDRKKCLEKYGYVCQVCGMNFEDTYGEIGRQFIEVHHLYPVCNMGEDYQFDPLDEERGLIPLCSNCHSMIHRGGRTEARNGERVMIPMTLAELKEEYERRNR